jgi:hypothetical protein
MFSNGLLTSSVSRVWTSGTFDVSREELPEIQNCEAINYLVIDFKS